MLPIVRDLQNFGLFGALPGLLLAGLLGYIVFMLLT